MPIKHAQDCDQDEVESVINMGCTDILATLNMVLKWKTSSHSFTTMSLSPIYLVPIIYIVSHRVLALKIYICLFQLEYK